MVFGKVIATEPKDMYMARVSAINDCVTDSAQALAANLLCGFGLQATFSVAQTVLSDDDHVTVGGIREK